MPQRKSSAVRFPVLSPSLQVDFWARFQQIRGQYLSESLAQTVRNQDIEELDRELLAIVGSDHLRALAAYSLRGETFYPVPCILKAKPLLLGYYRLLYGFSQKEFYSGVFGRFRRMEQDNQLNAQNDQLLPGLCKSLAQTGWNLFNGIQPVSQQVIHELQLLTVGPQLRGSRNVAIGKGATKTVFDLISALVAGHCEASTATVITVKNAAGRIVQIAFAPDPDITIIEMLPSGAIPSVSIEIKGGKDVSNVHNRIGEAEKSHQKAKAAGFTRYWTILKARVDPAAARRGSPTTTEFFNLDEILQRGSSAHIQFRDLLHQTIGIG
jgi:XcyI restriction endonuclease